MTAIVKYRRKVAFLEIWSGMGAGWDLPVRHISVVTFDTRARRQASEGKLLEFAKRVVATMLQYQIANPSNNEKESDA
jgi:hypothetical protein